MRNAVAALVTIALLVSYLVARHQADSTPRESRGALSMGWESYYPYQVLQDGNYTGLDTELIREALSRAGYQLQLVPQTWAHSLEQVRDGRLDGVGLAYKLDEREDYGRFSHPYMHLRTAAFYRLDRFRTLPHEVSELQPIIGNNHLRVGITEAYAYPDPVTDILKKVPTLAQPLDADSLARLAEGKVDLVFADELSGLSTLLANRWNRLIGCTVLDLPARPVHILFSRKSVSAETVDRINASIDEMNASGTTASITRTYYYPTLLNLLGQNFWLSQIGVIATATAAVAGLFLARRGGFSLIGAFLLAAAPAAGGGLLRDLICGRRPVALVADPTILITVLIMVLASWVLFRMLPEKLELTDLHPVVIFLDALGLAAFTVIGVVVAMQTRCEPLWMWGPLLAAVTNGGGALLRDVVRNEPVHVMHAGPLYLEISLLWGLVLSGFLHAYSFYPLPAVWHLQAAVGVTLVGVVAHRYLALNRGWRRPCF